MHLLQALIGEFLLPPYLFAWISLFGIFLVGSHPKAGRLLVLGSVALLVLFSFPIVSIIASDVRDPYRFNPGPYPKVDAIVILGGGRREFAVEYGAPETAGSSTLERLRYGAKLFREYRLPILVTGGRPHMGAIRGVLSEGDIMKGILEQEFGVPVRWVENKADDTIENAYLSAPLLRTDGVTSIFLVTDADHAKRATLAFENEGFSITPMPINFSPARELNINDFRPSLNGLLMSRGMFYDWLNTFRSSIYSFIKANMWSG